MNVLARLSESIQQGIADTFWSIATSLPVLGGLAAIVIAGLLARLLPVALIPAAVAGYVTLVRATGRAALCALLILIGYRIADERQAVIALKAELRDAQWQLANVRLSEQDKASLASAAQARADLLQEQVINPYVQKVEAVAPADVCRATDADVAFVRQFARTKLKKRRPAFDFLRGTRARG